MEIKPSKPLIAITELREAFKPYPYRDSKRYWTIGYGTWLEANTKLHAALDQAEAAGMDMRLVITIEKSFAQLFMIRELALTKASVMRAFPSIPDSPRLEALVCLAYTMGTAGIVTPRFPKMNAAIDRKDWTEGAAQILDSQWRKDVHDERANEVAQMFLTNLYPRWSTAA